MYQAILQEDGSLLDYCRRHGITHLNANRVGVALIVRGFRYGVDRAVGTHIERPSEGEWFELGAKDLKPTAEPIMRLNPNMNVIQHCFVDVYA